VTEVPHRDENELTEAMQARIHEELAPGERIVWAGRPLARALGPGAGRKARLILGVLPITAGLALLALSFEARRIDGRFGFGLALLLLGMFLLGLMALIERVNRRAREVLCYVLTDRRAITWVPEFGSQMAVRSFYPHDLARMYRVENPDGSGSVILSEVSFPGYKGVPATQPRGFLGIDRVREREQLIRDTLLRPEQR
jgi:hypothetical protein